MFKKIENDDKTKYGTFCSNSKAETIVNESDTDDVFESIYTAISSDIQNVLGKESGWVTDSVIDFKGIIFPVKIRDIHKIKK